MGVSYFVVTSPTEPAFRGSLRFGKSLAGAELKLAPVARELGVRPLSGFLSGDPEALAQEAALFQEETGIQVPAGAVPAEEEWFSPEQGLATVQALLDAIHRMPNEFHPSLEPALVELLGVLEEARRLNLRWHLDSD